MGQIANRMLIEAIYKFKDYLKQRKEIKQMKKNELLEKEKTENKAETTKHTD